jgi:hypothetical protein
MVKGSAWLLNEYKHTEIIATTVLAGDVSLTSAIGAGEWVRVTNDMAATGLTPQTSIDLPAGFASLVIAFMRGLAFEDIVAVCSIRENHRQGDDGADEKKRL